MRKRAHGAPPSGPRSRQGRDADLSRIERGDVAGARNRQGRGYHDLAAHNDSRAKDGDEILVDLYDLKVEYQGATLATRRSFIKQHPNLTQRVSRHRPRRSLLQDAERGDDLPSFEIHAQQGPRRHGRSVEPLRKGDAGEALRQWKARSKRFLTISPSETRSWPGRPSRVHQVRTAYRAGQERLHRPALRGAEMKEQIAKSRPCPI